MTGGALSNDLANLPRIVAALRAGGVVLLPTDTVLGLATLPNMQAGVDRLYALKDRPRAKALPIMVATSEQLADLGVSSHTNHRAGSGQSVCAGRSDDCRRD